MKDKLQGSLKSITMWAGYLVVLVGQLQANIDTVQQLVPPKYFGYIVSGLGVLMIVLRWLTNAPLEEKTQLGPQPAQVSQVNPSSKDSA